MKKPVELPPSVSTSDPLYQRERYTVIQAAAYLARCIDLIYRDVRARRIGYLRDGRGRILFSQADLDTWRQAHRVDATDAKTQRVRAVRSGHVRPIGERPPKGIFR